MKLIIEQFTRGENPFKILNIGKRIKIDNWFKTWSSDTNYEIDNNLNIKIKNYLCLKNYSQITFLPDNLHIKGFLDLNDLDLRGTKITSLPANLYVDGWLDLRDTKITSLPDDLRVDGIIYKDF